MDLEKFLVILSIIHLSCTLDYHQYYLRFMREEEKLLLLPNEGVILSVPVDLD